MITRAIFLLTLAGSRRIAALAVCWLCLAQAQVLAQAQPVQGLIIPSQAPWTVLALDTLPHTPLGTSLEDVLSGRAGQFQALQRNEMMSTDWNTITWLRIRLQAQAMTENVPHSPLLDTQIVTLNLHKPYLDDVRLYSPSSSAASGQSLTWSVQRGGDHLSPHDWRVFLRGLMPYFALPTYPEISQYQKSIGKPMTLYLSVSSTVPFRSPIQLQTLRDLQSTQSKLLLLYGLCFGAMIMVLLLTATTAFHRRDAIFSWYSAYALAAFLAALSHSGVAHSLVWSVSGEWAGQAVMFFIVIACSFQVAFCDVMLRRVFVSNTIRTVAYALLLCGLCAAAGMLLEVVPWKIRYFSFLGYFALVVVFCCWCAAQVARMGHVLGKVWLLTFVPLLATVFWAILDGIGLVQESSFTHSLVILASAFEVIALGLALQWMARGHHSAHIQAQTLASTDPLTGFLSAGVFNDELKTAWRESKKTGRDIGVVYIRVLRPHTSSAPNLAMLQRAVRIVRAATRSQDVVGRLDNSHLALFMPGVGMGEELTQRLSRIVALGLMPDTSDPQAMQLYFRIAATTRHSFDGSRQELDAALRTELGDRKEGTRRPIRTIDRRQKLVDSRLQDDQLDALWSEAMKAEQKGAMAHHAQAAHLSGATP